MKTKEIYSIFGVPPATLFDWSKPGHKKNNLAKLLKALSVQEAKEIISKADKQKTKPMMLLSTVNCSIGDKSKHFTLTDLKKLFYKDKNLNPYEKYAINIIKKEALKEEIDEFVKYYKIPNQKIEKVITT